MQKYEPEKEGVPQLTSETLLEQIKVILKDEFVATVRKTGDTLKICFPGGEVFRLTIWKEAPRRAERDARGS